MYEIQILVVEDIFPQLIASGYLKAVSIVAGSQKSHFSSSQFGSINNKIELGPARCLLGLVV